MGTLVDSVLIKACAALAGAMVLVVWLGILSRYGMQLGIGWTEIAARYVMIWAALLAIPVGVFRRQHIGFSMLFHMLPQTSQRYLRLILDLIGLGFFMFMAFYGTIMAAQGSTQFAMIFGITMLIPFASVPVAAALAALQIFIVMIRDFFHTPEAPRSGAQVQSI